MSYTIGDADTIIKKHEVHWLICIESYKREKLKWICRWRLIYDSAETCAYKNVDNGKVIMAFRGTDAPKDLYDDREIALGKVYPRVNEAIELLGHIYTLFPSVNITVTGHSLGGAIARDVGKHFSIEAATFNAAAPPSFPVVQGSRETAYHIVFDLISAWQSPRTIRIDKGFSPYVAPWSMIFPYMWLYSVFDSLLPSHSLVNFSKERAGKIVTPDEENFRMRKWFHSLPMVGQGIFLNALIGVSGNPFTTGLPSVT